MSPKSLGSGVSNLCIIRQVVLSCIVEDAAHLLGNSGARTDFVRSYQFITFGYLTELRAQYPNRRYRGGRAINPLSDEAVAKIVEF